MLYFTLHFFIHYYTIRFQGELMMEEKFIDSTRKNDNFVLATCAGMTEERSANSSFWPYYLVVEFHYEVLAHENTD